MSCTRLAETNNGDTLGKRNRGKSLGETTIPRSNKDVTGYRPTFKTPIISPLKFFRRLVFATESADTFSKLIFYRRLFST